MKSYEHDRATKYELWKGSGLFGKACAAIREAAAEVFFTDGRRAAEAGISVLHSGSGQRAGVIYEL